MAGPTSQDELVAAGLLGGRTVRILATGEVDCAILPVVDLADGFVRVRTVRSAVSPGTEMTFLGRDATNVSLRRAWDRRHRLFRDVRPPLAYPLTFGYRAVGEVAEGATPELPLGTRIFGSWRHTEYVALPVREALRQRLPAELSWDDGVDLAHMAPISVNAVAFAEGAHVGRAVVVFGAGPVGLITAQVARATGAQSVTVVDRLPGRLAVATGLGFVGLEAGAVADVALALKRRHGTGGIPVAWECTGSSAVLNEALRTVRRQGTVVAVGFYQGEAQGLRLGEEFHHNGVRLVCAQIGNVHRSMTRRGLRSRAIRLARRRRLILGSLPRAPFPVESAADAFEALRRPDEVLQVVFSYARA